MTANNAAMQIRQVDTQDPEVVSTLYRLQKLCLPGDRPMEVSDGFWWVAKVNGVECGFAALVPSSRWSDCGYMARAGVLPLYRGRGIQKKLILARVQKARRLGWRWLISDTTDNPASSNSLISCGFKLYKPMNPWSFKSALYWRRQIASKL